MEIWEKFRVIFWKASSFMYVILNIELCLRKQVAAINENYGSTLNGCFIKNEINKRKIVSKNETCLFTIYTVCARLLLTTQRMLYEKKKTRKNGVKTLWLKDKWGVGNNVHNNIDVMIIKQNMSHRNNFG